MTDEYRRDRPMLGLRRHAGFSYSQRSKVLLYRALAPEREACAHSREIYRSSD